MKKHHKNITAISISKDYSNIAQKEIKEAKHQLKVWEKSSVEAEFYGYEKPEWLKGYIAAMGKMYGKTQVGISICENASEARSIG